MVVPLELSTIIAGMDIIDKDGEQVGTVKSFHLNKEHVSHQPSEEIKEKVLQALNDTTQVSVEQYENGFLYVERSFFRGDILVFPEQINEIKDDSIYLNVTVDDLLEIEDNQV